jgi:hypothetical protein
MLCSITREKIDFAQEETPLISIRKLALILALALSLGLAGCGGEESQQQNETSGSSMAMMLPRSANRC